MTATLTHPEWDKETSGLEIAKAFADQIRGKNGTFGQLLLFLQMC